MRNFSRNVPLNCWSEKIWQVFPAVLFTIFSSSLIAAERPIEHSFQILNGESGFSPVEETLKELVSRTHAQYKENHFCVIGQTLEEGDKEAWVYWREGKALVLWKDS